MTYHNEYLIFAYNFHMLLHTVLNIIISVIALGPLVESDRKNASILPDYHNDEFRKCNIILQLSRINSNVYLRDVLL
jgi:hypothetical protein